MSEEKKIVVDEDWKSQVEAEREVHAKEQEEQAPQGEEAGYPPASFLMLVSTFATEAMVALGQIARPGTTEAVVNLDHAKFVIDTLEVLQQKTKGNLTGQEADTLTSLMHQLRMLYVAMTTGAPPTEEETGGDDSSKIVTP